MATPNVTLPEALRGPLDCLLIDNFDSFTWNLYQQLSLLGAKVTVIRNDAISPEAFPLLQLNSLIISPGPGHPKTDSGVSRDAIRYFTGKVPILGVCMGLECLVDVFGGEIAYAGEIKHGKLSPVKHDNRGCFVGVPQGFQSTRYHSLSTNVATLPDELAITATTQESGVVMGVRHRKYTLESVQYHPESILSEEGDTLLRNFLKLKGGLWEENPESNVHVSLPPFPIEVPEGDEKAKANAAKVPTILEKIYAQRRADVEAAKQTPGSTPTDLDTFLAMNLAPPLVSFVSRLRSAATTTITGTPAPALLAEIKRASPSKGPIALNANVAQQAQTYALSGAAVISVLTEPHWFKGSLLDMRLARQAVDALPNRPAILRKEFILDEYQIAEARLHGADTVLLIVAMLPLTRLHALYAYSVSLGMEPLVEVNSAKEMQVALELGAKVIGVNNRNLHNFEVDMGTTSRLADMVKGREGVILLALSGISGPQDVRGYVQEGVGGVLVGEALMRAPDVAAFIRELLDRPPEPVAAAEKITPLVKICGIRTPEEALAAAEAGADLLGLMFVPSSKRHIDLPTAQAISTAVRNGAKVDASPSTPADDYANSLWFSGHAKRLRASASIAKRPLLVGVFQDQPLADILHAVASTPLDLVQLHGSEPTEWARAIPVPVIRVFHIANDGSGVKGITAPGPHEFVLLDAMRADGLSGGSGKVVDWDVARAIVEAGEVYSKAGVSAAETMLIILAGGLTPENVADAVGKVKPWAVDVSGGVEVAGGAGKDFEKVRAFVQAAKGAA